MTVKRPFNKKLEDQLLTLKDQVKEAKDVRKKAQNEVDRLFTMLQAQTEAKAFKFDTPEGYDAKRNAIDSLDAEYRKAKEILSDAEIKYRSVKADYDDIKDQYGKEFYQFIEKHWNDMIELANQAQKLADKIKDQGNYCNHFAGHYIPTISGRFNSPEIIGHGSSVLRKGLK